MKKDEKAYFGGAFLGNCHITLNVLHSRHSEWPKPRRCPDEFYPESNFRMLKRPAPILPSPLAGDGRMGEGRIC